MNRSSTQTSCRRVASLLLGAFVLPPVAGCEDCGCPADAPSMDAGASGDPDARAGGDASEPDASAPSGGRTGDPYEIGSPTLTDLFVSPSGDDDNAGTTLAAPLLTLRAAWGKIPEGRLTTGVRINLLPGAYPCGEQELVDCNNGFAGRTGTYEAPIVLQAVDAGGQAAAGTATIRGGMDLYDVHYVYMIGLSLVAGPADQGLPTNVSGNDVLHIASSDHVLLRQVELAGPNGTADTENNIQEVLKVNHAQEIFVEESDLSGTFQTVLDYMSVQGGHVLNSRIHRAGGRCAYVKGGSAYLVVAGNELFDCHEAGFQAGEGSTLNLMQAPFIHFEAYDVKFVNNVVHDIYGPGVSVAGGYDILMAYNTFYRVGLSDGRSWGLLQLMHGGRTCSIVDEYPSAAAASARCQKQLDLGGWGTAEAGNASETGGEWIPDRSVYVYNNVFYNPAGAATEYIHFTVNGPAELPGDAVNIPVPDATDGNLQIRGNLIWNGGKGLELLGTANGSEPGCSTSNATCNPAQLAADNTINVIEPELTDPAGGDFRPRVGGNVLGAAAYPVPDFTWDEWPAGSNVPAGTLDNSVGTNRNGEPRSGADHPGAY